MESMYFERRGGDTPEFWEVELEGSWYGVYSGRVGCQGEGSWQYSTSAREAEGKVRRLVAGKLAEGFARIDPPPPLDLAPGVPELLEGPPLADGELARFTEQAISRPTELERIFWDVQLDRLFAEWDFAGDYASYHLPHPRTMAQEFEAVAAWDSPSMGREVERDGRGMVTEIRYRIGGLVVLTLRNSHFCLPVFPFFSEHGRWLHRPERIQQELRLLLTRFPSFCAEGLLRMGAYVERKSKRRKLKALAEVGMAMMVHNCMRGTDLEYRLLPGHKRSFLQVGLGATHLLELIMPYASFAGRIAGILPTVGVARGLLERVELGISLGDRRRWDAWGTVLWHEHRRYSEDPRLDFWGERYLAYERAMAVERGDFGPGQLDIQTVWGWNIPGVEGSLEHLGDNLYAIRYSIGGRDVLTVGHDALDFRLAGMKHRTQLPKGSVPTMDALRALLEGLPAFYHAGTVAFNQRFEDAKRVERVAGVLERIGRRWVMDLSQGEHLVVELHMPGVLFLELRLQLANFEGQLAQLRPTVARVMRAMEEAPLRFKLYPRELYASWATPWVRG
ncbi:MAG: hypothetical protein CSA07_04160 [Bacteroidia bacterium]|nr:MAG: hypothetical protein CSA07_04160 [Bacteroidia bacterium]